MVERPSVRAEAKLLANAYLPSLVPLNTTKNSKGGSQVRKSHSRSPPAESHQGRRNRAPKPTTELEKQKNM